MSLNVGSRLGHYDMTALIGEGGRDRSFRRWTYAVNRRGAECSGGRTEDARTMSMATTDFDQSKKEAFAGRMMGVLNDGFLAVMISVGYRISCMHCMPVSLAYDGMGLGAMWGEEKAKEMIEETGMQLVDIKQVEGDPINNFYIARRPA